MVHPNCWEFRGGEWLPVPAKLHLDPGVNGISDSGNPDVAVAQMNRNGWIVIRPSDQRLGEFAWYVQELPKQGPGKIYTDVRDSASVVGGRVFWEFDEEGWIAFCRHLVTSGICQPMDRQVYGLEVSKQQARVDRLEGVVSTAPNNQVAAGRLAVERGRLDAMIAARPDHLKTDSKGSKRKSPGKRKIQGSRVTESEV